MLEERFRNEVVHIPNVKQGHGVIRMFQGTGSLSKRHKVHGQNLFTNVTQWVQPAQTYNCTVIQKHQVNRAIEH